MKNYELIAELSKYPAGHEVSIEVVVDACKVEHINKDLEMVTTEIVSVEPGENCIFLC